jgi:molybdopterin/thiamine biosynthesis adenylyltransferase
MAPQIYFELKNAVVGIAGLGGLGSNVGVALTRLKVGRHKVDASIENFRRINQDTKLEEAGMGTIARRTVAKYRKILNIPTARFRKLLI